VVDSGLRGFGRGNFLNDRRGLNWLGCEDRQRGFDEPYSGNNGDEQLVAERG
jgi:hypothetical protein